MEGFWDRKMPILERFVFAISVFLLLTPDSAVGMESIFGIVSNTHILGMTIFVVSMGLHKMMFKEGMKYAKAN